MGGHNSVHHNEKVANQQGGEVVVPSAGVINCWVMREDSSQLISPLTPFLLETFMPECTTITGGHESSRLCVEL